MSSSSTIPTGVRAHIDAIAACDPAQTEIDEAGIQALLTSAVKLYAARVDRDGTFAGVARGSITATDALVTAATLLRAVNVAPFELGLWEAWS
jgi:hypothetical protein